MKYCKLCKAWDHEKDHEKCKYIQKFKCACGCNRFFNLIELDNLGLTPKSKEKCKRPLIKCDLCETKTCLLFKKGNNFECYKCITNEYKTLITELDHCTDIINDCSNKIKIAERLIKFYKQEFTEYDIIQFIKDDVIKLDTLSESYKESYYQLLDYQILKNELLKATCKSLQLSNSLNEYIDSYLIIKNIITTNIILMRNNIFKEIRHMIIVEYIKDNKNIKISSYYSHKYK